jgi:hypothetical protein
VAEEKRRRDLSTISRWPGTWDPRLIESSKKLAAATVATRLDFLRQSLTEEKSRLEAINRGKFRFSIGQDLEKRIKAMEAELTFLHSWRGLGEPAAPKLDCSLRARTTDFTPTI